MGQTKRQMKSTPMAAWLAAALLVTACGSIENDMIHQAYDKLVEPPVDCNNGDPTAVCATDFPAAADLTAENSQNLHFSDVDNGLSLVEGTGGGGSTADTDDDGVPDAADECSGPGWRWPCGDPSDDGVFHTLQYDDDPSASIGADIDVVATIRSADAYFLMDSSGSMTGEHAQLVTDLLSGEFLTEEEANECDGYVDAGLVGAMKCVLPDVHFGLGQFNEYPVLPHGEEYDQTPYHHHLDITDNVQYFLNAVSSLVVHYNKDKPEGSSQAMYSVVSGQGLGPWVPNKAECESEGWGYPCFRKGALPIIVLITDANMWNGPREAGGSYSSFGALGKSALLPPVVQFPEILYSDKTSTAHDLGDLTNRSMTVMGTTALFGDNFRTHRVRGCRKKGWYDGRDAVVKFSMSGSRFTYLSSWGSFFPAVNLELFNSTKSTVRCEDRPGPDNWWAELTHNLHAGVWYAVTDAKRKDGKGLNWARGPYQIRIQTTAADPSWATKDTPVSWIDVESELLARNVKFVTVVSEGGPHANALADAEELSFVTNSVDQDGVPYISGIDAEGGGLSPAVLDALRALVGNTRRDISLVAEDNPSTITVDESKFVSSVSVTKCPTTGVSNCTGASGNVCGGCLAQSEVGFEFRLANNFVSGGPTGKVFDFDMVALAAGTVELTRVPVRIFVPPAEISYGEGWYQNSYDAELSCNAPHERPDWGYLTWGGETPGDTEIELQLFTADTKAELDTVDPVSIRIPSDTQSHTLDVAHWLEASGQQNLQLHLRVRAVLRASTDGSQTPIFDGWSLRFNCYEYD